MTGSTATEESATESNHDVSTNGSTADVKNGKPNETKVSEEAKKTKNGRTEKQEPSGPGDWSFPYRLASEWNVWYDKPAQKKQSRTDYNSSMKNIYQFDSVKAFWGLYNHLNLEKMPVGANLRIFKTKIQPTWEDEKNREGGNWILVPRGDGRGDQRTPGLLVYKELLLAIIGGDLDNLVNGIVLSIKAKDIIIQVWLPSTGPRRRNKVRSIAEGALKQYCPQFVDEPGKPRLEWTWRAHPTATLLKKPGEEGGEEDVLPSGEGSRGSCGECLQNRSCAVM